MLKSLSNLLPKALNMLNVLINYKQAFESAIKTNGKRGII